MTMTKKGQKKQQYGWLKATLLTGSMAATLLGTRLLAAQDRQAAAAALAKPDPIVITVPVQVPGLVTGAPATASSTLSSSGQLLLDLPPIPQAVSPALNPAAPVRPVARSQSSR